MFPSCYFAANVGAALAGIMFFGFYFPYMFVQSDYEDMSTGEKLGLCFLFNMAMAYGANIIGLAEGTGEYFCSVVWSK